MTKDIELWLESDGFYAARKLKNGKLGKGAHLITEEEIMTMFTAIIRVFAEKTGRDTMMINGDDGKAVIVKLIEAETAKSAE